MIIAGIHSKHLGKQQMLESMKSEGKRVAASFWQRINLFNDIVLIAPMLGLLGTVVGMFYAFYDINRSAETLSALFDGLGIAIGTTVAGLVVAIISMIFHATLKYRLIRSLTYVENEAINASHYLQREQI
jgi:biopolymer transport protein ExbB